MLEWLNLVADNWQLGIFFLSLLPPILAFAHMIYFIYIAPDDDEDNDGVPGAGNDDGVATAIQGGVSQPVRSRKKKHNMKHT